MAVTPSRTFVFPEPPLLPTGRRPTAEVNLLFHSHRNQAASLNAWDTALASTSLDAILETCTASDQRKALATTLLGALSAALSTAADNPVRAVTLLAAALAAGAGTCASSLPVLHAAVVRLLSPDSAQSLVVTGQGPEIALAATLESIVQESSPSSSSTAGSANAKKPTTAASELLTELAGVVIRRQSPGGAHAGHPGLIRALSHSTYLHAAAAEAIEKELRAGGARVRSGLLLLAATADKLKASKATAQQPTAPLLCFSFLVQAIAARAPLVIAAGVDAGVIFRHAAFEGLSAAARSSAHRMCLELVTGLASRNLPSTVLPPRALRQLTSLLLERAVDDDTDLPSRSYTICLLTELVDSANPWATDDGVAAVADDDEADAAGDEIVGAEGASACERSYARCTATLLSALPQAASTSKPLTSKLLQALCSVLRHNPWHAALSLEAEPLDAHADSAQAVGAHADSARAVSVWSRTLAEHFEPILDALEAVGDASHPLLPLLEKAHLGARCLGALLRRSTAASAARAAQATEAPPTRAAPSGGGIGGCGAKQEKGLHIFTRLLRLQLVRGGGNDAGGADGDDGNNRAPHAASRLVSVVVASECDASECDALRTHPTRRIERCAPSLCP